MTARAPQTPDPADLFQRPEEARALHEYNPDADPAPRDVALQWLDRIAATIADHPDLADLPRVPGDHACDVETQHHWGLCHDCADDARQQHRLDEPLATRERRLHRYAKHRRRHQIGTVAVCRRHALLRLQAADHATQGLPQSPPRPLDLDAWINAAAVARITPRAVELHLQDWHIDGDTRIGLLERHADLQAAQALLANDNDAWLSRQPHAPAGRCARCRQPSGDQPLYTIDGRDICGHCATTHRPHHDPRQEAA